MKLSFFAKAVIGSSLLLCLTGLFVACEHTSPTAQQQQQQPPAGLQATLSSIQDKIFTPKCATAGCHVPNGIGPMSMRNTTESFQNLVGVPLNRPRVVRGDASTSILYIKVTDNFINAGGSRMPQGGLPLSQAEQDSIKAWINRGAQNN
jgi:hypothetical protein